MITLKDKEFIDIITYMKNNFGIDLKNKRTLIESRMQSVLEKYSFCKFSQYYEYLISDKTGAAVETLVNKLTTNHTFFMREVEHFNYLREVVLPYLEASNSKNKDLRIWSAGCSTGEEPYGVQMLIHEYLGDKKNFWDTKILATDISTKVLKKAETGIYSTEGLSSTPKLWINKYFNELDDKNSLVKDNIRAQIIFRKFNLMNDFSFKKKFHVIFCRNVMIYFDTKTKMELVDKFYEYTEDGGYLFIGHSESASFNRKYKYIMPSIYRKI